MKWMGVSGLSSTTELWIKGLYGLAPGLDRQIQIAVVQSVALYGAELCGKGRKTTNIKSSN